MDKKWWAIIASFLGTVLYVGAEGIIKRSLGSISWPVVGGILTILLLNNLLGFWYLRKYIHERYTRTEQIKSCSLFDRENNECDLGITGLCSYPGESSQDVPDGVHQLSETDMLSEAKHAYKWFGLSAVNVAPPNLNQKAMLDKGSISYTFYLLNSRSHLCTTLQARHEEVKPSQIEDQILSTISVIRQLGKPRIRYETHEMIPCFRLIEIDDNKIYLGCYPPKSCGHFAPFLELDTSHPHFVKDSTGNEVPLSLGLWFKHYLQTMEMEMLRRALERAILEVVLRDLELELGEICLKVKTDFPDLVRDFGNVFPYDLTDFIRDVVEGVGQASQREKPEGETAGDFGGIRVVFFDVGDTLYSSKDMGEQYVLQLEQLLSEDQGIDLEQARRIIEQKTIELKSSIPHVTKVSVMESLGYIRKQVHQAFNKVEPARYLKEDNQLRKLLQLLSSKYELGIITNFQRVHTKRILEALGIGVGFFKYFIGEEDVSEIKPNPEPFQLALKKAHVEADRAVYVADSVSKDLQPAKFVGMKTILVGTAEGRPRGVNVVIPSVYDLSEVL